MLQKNREYYHSYLKKDPFEKWDKSRMPETRVDSLFIRGMQILLVEPDNPDALEYLKRCLLIADRAIEEGKLQSKECAAAFPRNRGQLVRGRSYAEALLGNGLPSARLLEASHDFEDWSRETMKHNANEQVEAYYLASIRLALVAKDTRRAADLLSATPLSSNSIERELLACLAALTAETGDRLLKSFDEYFDRVRDPKAKMSVFIERDILSFELSVLREMYLSAPAESLKLRRVLDAIAR
jgi:hypothetical protein